MSFHERLVVTELECAFITKRPGAPAAALRITFPAIGIVGEHFIPGEMVHHPQLHYMQTMIEGAGQHGESRSRFLVERPETSVVAMEIGAKRCNRECEQIPRRGVASRKRIVVNFPDRPEETIQNMRGRRDDVFLEPKIAALVGEADSAFVG